MYDILSALKNAGEVLTSEVVLPFTIVGIVIIVMTLLVALKHKKP